jgi:hypothetical protein
MLEVDIEARGVQECECSSRFTDGNLPCTIAGVIGEFNEEGRAGEEVSWGAGDEVSWRIGEEVSWSAGEDVSSTSSLDVVKSVMSDSLVDG